MDHKFGRIAEYVESLEQSELMDEQQYMLLVGGVASHYVGTGNNCQCNGNDCSCNTIVGPCGN